jgi:hypothetical protein
LRERKRVNAVLTKRIKLLFDDPYLAQEVLRCVLPGRKVRSILFLKTVQQLNPGVEKSGVSAVLASIELIHGASVLVDDMLDSDQFRHGVTTTESTWQKSKSILFAHLLGSTAIQSLDQFPGLQRQIALVYHKMCIGEMHDVLLVPGDWIYQGYDVRTVQKTCALFEFVLASAQILAKSTGRNLHLDKIGRQMGMLYQLSNDFYDWQAYGIEKRHLPTQSWPITFSFPLAVYLSKYSERQISKHLKKKILTHDEWLEFISRLWKPDVRCACEETIAKTQKELLGLIQKSSCPDSLKQLYQTFVNLIVTEGFWYHIYEME